MKQTLSILAVVAGMLTSSGCSTMIERGGGLHVVDYHRKPGVYPGVRAWPYFAKEFLTRPEGSGDFTHFGPFALPFVLVDFSLSAGIDTALLPADAIYFLTQPMSKQPLSTQPAMRSKETPHE